MIKHHITFIGSGNVAWHLAPALDSTGYIVGEVYSTNSIHAQKLCERLYEAHTCSSLDFSSSPSRIFIIATTDEAIPAIAKEIILPDNSMLAHTSGSQPIDVLYWASATYYGVFYPLQTFNKERKVLFNAIPLLIESNDAKGATVLTKMAKSIGAHPEEVSSTERKVIHIAAVFASNFVNHMLTISADILYRNGFNFELLKSLTIETVKKALLLGPKHAQTGPAFRKDMYVVEDHLNMLAEERSIADIYHQISQHIIHEHRDKSAPSYKP